MEMFREGKLKKKKKTLEKLCSWWYRPYWSQVYQCYSVKFHVCKWDKTSSVDNNKTVSILEILNLKLFLSVSLNIFLLGSMTSLFVMVMDSNWLLKTRRLNKEKRMWTQTGFLTLKYSIQRGFLSLATIWKYSKLHRKKHLEMFLVVGGIQGCMIITYFKVTD